MVATSIIVTCSVLAVWLAFIEIRAGSLALVFSQLASRRDGMPSLSGQQTCYQRLTALCLKAKQRSPSWRFCKRKCHVHCHGEAAPEGSS